MTGIVSSADIGTYLKTIADQRQEIRDVCAVRDRYRKDLMVQLDKTRAAEIAQTKIAQMSFLDGFTFGCVIGAIGGAIAMVLLMMALLR